MNVNSSGNLDFKVIYEKIRILIQISDLLFYIFFSVCGGVLPKRKI